MPFSTVAASSTGLGLVVEHGLSAKTPFSPVVAASIAICLCLAAAHGVNKKAPFSPSPPPLPACDACWCTASTTKVSWWWKSAPYYPSPVPSPPNNCCDWGLGMRCAGGGVVSIYIKAEVNPNPPSTGLQTFPEQILPWPGPVQLRLRIDFLLPSTILANPICCGPRNKLKGERAGPAHKLRRHSLFVMFFLRFL